MHRRPFHSNHDASRNFSVITFNSFPRALPTNLFIDAMRGEYMKQKKDFWRKKKEESYYTPLGVQFNRECNQVARSTLIDLLSAEEASLFHDESVNFQVLLLLFSGFYIPHQLRRTDNPFSDGLHQKMWCAPALWKETKFKKENANQLDEKKSSSTERGARHWKLGRRKCYNQDGWIALFDDPLEMQIKCALKKKWEFVSNTHLLYVSNSNV